MSAIQVPVRWNPEPAATCPHPDCTREPRHLGAHSFEINLNCNHCRRRSPADGDIFCTVCLTRFTAEASTEHDRHGYEFPGVDDGRCIDEAIHGGPIFPGERL